jgi:ABC-type Fe3+-siderophore transport system permease subunit
MPQDNDLIYRKDLSPERIRQLQKAAAAYRYYQNCITAAFVGAVIAVLTALLLGISFGLTCILIGFFGAAAGYAFYALGQYLQKKYKDSASQPPD